MTVIPMESLVLSCGLIQGFESSLQGVGILPSYYLWEFPVHEAYGYIVIMDMY